MKVSAAGLLLMLLCGATCNKTGSNPCYKGRLTIRGICANYVITVLEGNLSGLSLTKSWTDETDGKVYENVFTLSNPCSFPDIKEGNEFYFTVEKNSEKPCIVCQAFRPVPRPKIS